jgi:hypothetical protein
MIGGITIGTAERRSVLTRARAAKGKGPHTVLMWGPFVSADRPPGDGGRFVAVRTPTAPIPATADFTV